MAGVISAPGSNMVIGLMTIRQPILTNGFPARPAIKALGGLFGTLG
jgi:hypothetical protein